METPPSLSNAPVPRRFRDRRDAGRRLAGLLERYRPQDPVVVGIPRGGVPVAAEVARSLGAPLDVIVARKLGAPNNPEYGIGAIAEGGARVISEEALARLHIGPYQLARLLARAEAELAALVEHLRDGRAPLSVEGRTVILVDDGLATGRTAHAAALSLRARGASQVILAVPVAATISAAELCASVDEVVCEQMPHDLWAIGFWYEDFSPTSEAEVLRLLGHRTRARQVKIEAPGGVLLAGDLTIPAQADGVVVFAHGSGSSRSSPRNRKVAEALNEAGLGTLLFDLLTGEEERARANVFDIPLLAERLVAAVHALGGLAETRGMSLGCFGASTGAAAALVAAAELAGEVRAVVSRGGRPDFASERLADVQAPTLLIVGSEDHDVLKLNRLAAEKLRCRNELAVVPGATHLFEEPGALDRVAQLAIEWFKANLSWSARPCPPR